MADSIAHGWLPPSKRYKLLHQQPDSPSHHHHHHHHPPPTPICLPAKKRIWASLPLSPIKPPPPHQEDQEDDDDGVICAVCAGTDGNTQDPIVFCDGCDLTVHASCYGNPLARSIPEGDWFCLRCTHKIKGGDEEEEVVGNCSLCPVEGGAVKPTTDGEWAHIMCALLVPEVFFQDPPGREGIDCSRVPARRREAMCSVCGTNCGCAIECSEPRCGLGFHVSCGLAEGLCLEYKEGKGGAIVAGFCEEHTQLWKKQQLSGKYKIVAREDNLKRKARN